MKTSVTMVLTACVLPILVTANTPPEITNVKANQRAGTKLVDITYDAADADGDALKVRVEVSSDDGKTYSVPASSFSGDFGEGVMPGTGKKIVWDAGTDWDGEYSDKMKVKVFALDGQGYPGMAFGDEVPPGGFLMGQDGGEEGNGPSRHVCIPWSYWLSKYEVTNNQYCDFLNTAYAMGYVTQSGATNVFATASLPVGYPQSSDATLCNLGDNYGIRWNVNKFEVVSGCTNRPVSVTWYGAMTFCRFYGYDLPTEAEWEMAARGPDNDDENEHLKYSWGNDDSIAGRCFEKGTDGNLGDVGKFPVGPYGLYDIMGNAAEWTRSLASSSIETRPTTEALTNSCNKLYTSASRVVRGTYEGNYMLNPIYVRTGAAQTSDGGNLYGFRVVRRYPSQPDSAKRLFISENFDSWTEVPSSWHPISVEVVANPVTGALATDKVIKLPEANVESGGGEYKFYLPDSVDAESVVEVSFEGLGGNYQNSAEMTFYSGVDPDYDSHGNSSSVAVSFPTIDNPRNWVWTMKSFAPAFTDKGFQHCFSVGANTIPIYINNLKVYVEEVVTP